MICIVIAVYQIVESYDALRRNDENVMNGVVQLNSTHNLFQCSHTYRVSQKQRDVLMLFSTISKKTVSILSMTFKTCKADATVFLSAF